MRHWISIRFDNFSLKLFQFLLKLTQLFSSHSCNLCFWLFLPFLSKFMRKSVEENFFFVFCSGFSDRKLKKSSQIKIKIMIHSENTSIGTGHSTQSKAENSVKYFSLPPKRSQRYKQGFCELAVSKYFTRKMNKNKLSTIVSHA